MDFWKDEEGEMKTVGLLTLHRVMNCGSQLQTYATVKAVESLGYACTVIDYLYPSPYHVMHSLGDENKYGGRLRSVKKILGWFGLLRLARCFTTWMKCRRAGVRFRQFADVRITRPYSHARLRRNLPQFDIYLTGSDQTWNPRYLAKDFTYLLDFCGETANRVAYAASFGCNALPDWCKADYAKCLSRYSAISVRESSGVGIVRDLVGKVAADVLDPTFLLCREDWLPKASQRVPSDRRFIFCYILSYVFNPFSYVIDLVRKLASDLNAEVVFYTGEVTDGLRASGFEIIDAHVRPLPPDEFLEYFEKAEFVVTTSFHGTAFSANFKKNFYAILNPNATKDDRVRSFLSKVELESRGIEMGGDLSRLPSIETDYTVAGEKMKTLRTRSMDYLEKALQEAAR